MTTQLLLSILVRGAAFVGVVAIGVLLMRRASAAHRHFAWTLAAVALLVLPVLSLALPEFDVAVLPAVVASAPARADAVPAIAAPRPFVGAPAEAPVAQTPDPAPIVAPDAVTAGTPPTVAAPTQPVPILLVVWLAGALVVAARFLLGTLAVRRLVRRADPVTDGRVAAIAGEALSRFDGLRAPALLVSADVDTPLTVGAFRPRVLLPAAALAWPAEVLRLSLLHEFAHVRRRDLLAEFVARLALVVHWPNPLAWITLSRLRIERERASDDLVLRAGNDAREYADLLVSLARTLTRNPTRAALAATMAGGPQFEGRVRAILDDGRRRAGPSLRAGSVFALLGGVAMSFAACVRPTERGAETVEAPVVSTDAQLERLAELGYVAGAKASASTEVVTVALDGSGQFTSVQAAVDAAPEGAVVRVGPGTFDEHVLVAKPGALSIEGAGADQTTIVSDVASKDVLERVWAEFQPKLAAAKTEAERATAHAELRRLQAEALTPTLRVRGSADVLVRGLTLSGRGEHSEGGATPGSVIDVADSTLRIEKCAVVGSPGSGVTIGQGSSVTIDGCLVAAVWDSGIVVGAPGDRPSTVRIANCDIRNCWQRGITVAPGNRSVTIEANRISGASWHGIRYDSAAPVVRGNLIFENVRSGIYASGKTEGRIEGNLFFRNGMSDVSCWYQAKDVIEGNTFVESQREAVAILGGASPTVRRNVFAGCKLAFSGDNIADGGAGSAYTGGGQIGQNVHWQNGSLASWERAPFDEGKSKPAGPSQVEFVVADPQFTDPAHRDYSLATSSPARSMGAGVATPLTFASPWPARPEETATLPKPLPQPPEPRPVADVKAQAGALAAVDRAKADVLQITDPARREAGLVAIGAAMQSGDSRVVSAALASLYQVRDVKYDKRRFRDDVLRHLAGKDADVQRAAGYALLQVEREPGDLDRVLTVAETTTDPSANLLFVALTLNGDRADGRLAALFVKALAIDDPVQGAMDTANNLRRMWVAPEVEDAVVAAWRRHPTGRNGSGMWPYIFGQMTSPARESRVRAIFELLAPGDDAMRQLAGVAVTRRVDDSAQALAAQLAADAIPAAKTSALRRTYVDVIRVNGSREQVPMLRALAANAMLDEDLRAVSGKVADELERAR